jgi:hypothetical protein
MVIIGHQNRYAANFKREGSRLTTQVAEVFAPAVETLNVVKE